MSSPLHSSREASASQTDHEGPNIPAFFDAVGTIRSIFPSGPSALIYSQGDPAHDVFHVQEGTVKKSVLSRDGREAVVAVLGPGDFFGEECLAGQPLRMATASALTEGTLLVIEKREMFRLLHGSAPIADWFLSHTLARLRRIEDDLADQRCNPGEKRLARALLLLARYGKNGEQQRVLPKLSQTMLAEMVGTTRSRVNFFLNKFKRQGFINYADGNLTVTNSLHRVVDEESNIQ
jgi:CRP/FNR family transcriptional regulator, cyclic AMP receptor protein